MTVFSKVFVCCLFMVSSLHGFGQLCGSHLTFRIMDATDSTLYPVAVDTTVSDTMNRLLYITTLEWSGSMTEANFTTVTRDSLSYFELATGCGIDLWHVEIQMGRETMELKFENLEMDIDFFVDSIPFQPGSYRIDFENLSDAKEHHHADRIYDWVWGYVLNGRNELIKEY